MRNRKTAEGDVFIAIFNEKNRTVSDEKLSRTFADVGRRYGYDDVVAEFVELTDFKVSDPFTISYELQLFTVCRQAGEPIILTGQGSDEYFGGCASPCDSQSALTI